MVNIEKRNEEIENRKKNLVKLLKNNDDEKLIECIAEMQNDMVERIKDEIGMDVESRKTIEVDKVEKRMFENIILPGERFTIKENRNKGNVNLGKLVKGMAGLGWNEADEERSLFMNSANNQVLIPTSLSEEIIDLARSNSGLLGNVPIVPMDSTRMKLIVQKKDAEAHFINEGDLISSSEAVFEGIDLKGRTIAMFIPVSLELLETADNLTGQLEITTAKAIAQALDKALINGNGEVAEKPTEIKGILKYEEINKVTNPTMDYDLIIKGIKAIKKANYKPSNICYSTDTGADLEIQKDSTGQYINKPKILESYITSESNNIDDNKVMVYDANAIILGVHKDIKVEWGTTSDLFQRLQVGLRVHLRADLAVINPKGISLCEVQE